MTALEECREQLARIRARMRAYQEQLKEITDSGERGRIQTKLKTYRAAVRDIQVQINHLDPPEARKARREHRKKLDIGANWDFFELSLIHIWHGHRLSARGPCRPQPVRGGASARPALSLCGARGLHKPL